MGAKQDAMSKDLSDLEETDRSDGASASDLSGSISERRQRLFVVRHGERLDNVDYSWLDTADRPYDPPITEEGVTEAKSAGERFVGQVF